MQIRLKIKELAIKRGYNQSTLARAADVDFKTIKRSFRESDRDIALSTIVKIAIVLGVPVESLIVVEGYPGDWQNCSNKNTLYLH